MLISLRTLLAILSSMVRSRAALELENLALRHQIGVLQRSARKRPKLTSGDRLFWVCLSRLWRNWRSALAIVKPETVVAWHRAGFRLFWTWMVRRGHPGTPCYFPREFRELILARCAGRIPVGEHHAFTANCSNSVSTSARPVSARAVRCRKPPSQTWRTFPGEPASCSWSPSTSTPCQPSISRFSTCFLVLAHHRRLTLSLQCDRPPDRWRSDGTATAGGASFDQPPRYLLRDRDAIFGNDFREQCEYGHPRSAVHTALALAEILRRASDWFHSARVPDHVIVFHERSLRRTSILISRLLSPIANPILSLGEGRHRSHDDIQPAAMGPVVAVSRA